MMIEVTAADIRKGKRSDYHFCPVALAINRQTGITSCVDDKWLELYLPGRFPDTFKVLPRSVRRFIRKFDKHGRKAVEPFSFRLPFRKSELLKAQTGPLG